MMPYVDGFVVPVPKKNLDAYRKWRGRPARYGASTARSNFRMRRRRRQAGQVDVVSQSVKLKDGRP